MQMSVMVGLSLTVTTTKVGPLKAVGSATWAVCFVWRWFQNSDISALEEAAQLLYGRSGTCIGKQQCRALSENHAVLPFYL